MNKVLSFWDNCLKFNNKIRENNYEVIESTGKLVEKIRKVRNKRELKFKDEEVKFLYKNKKICSFSLNASRKNCVSAANQEVLTDYPIELFNLYCLDKEDYDDLFSFDSSELKSFNGFKNDLDEIFNTFDLNRLVNSSPENMSLIKRLVIGVELIKHSNYIMKMIKNSFEDDRNSDLVFDKSMVVNSNSFDEFFSEILFIFDDFELVLKNLKSISNESSEWHLHKNSYLDSMFNDFNAFISSLNQIIDLKNDRFIQLLNQISFSLIQQIRNTSFEAEHFNMEIKKEIRMKRITNIIHEVKKAENMDLCFLMDCTGSMNSHINECNSVIRDIVDGLKQIFRDLKMRFSFVGYFDLEKENNRYRRKNEKFDFSEDLNQFKDFFSKVKAGGGNLRCEDVHGGLDVII